MEDKPELIPKKEVFFEWSSPSRLFKKRTREFYINIAVMLFLFMVILIFASEYMLIIAVLSIVFFVYVTSSVPPEEIRHRITNLGIESGNRFYHWEDLVDFWFEKQWEQTKMILRPRFGVHILILLAEPDKDKIRELIAKYIHFRETPQKNWVDNAASWLSEKIPLEKPAS